MSTCQATVRQIQGILGASRRYPYLATLEDPEGPGRVQLMFGSECLASYRRADLGTRNGLAGMLVSAGVRQADVARVFGVDVRQVRRYGAKFEAEGLAAVAAGVRGRPRKVSAEVERFVRAEFRAVFSRRRRGFRKELVERVEREFGVRLGLERLRQITAPVRAELEAAGAADVAARSARGTEAAREVGAPQEGSAAAAGAGWGEPGDGGEAREGLSQERLRRGFRTRYAGGLVLNVFFAGLLAGAAETVGSGVRRLFEAFAGMVMAMVGFGATNLERAKALVRREFGVLVELEASPTLATLRRWLAALAETVEAGRVQAALTRNYLEQIVGEARTFYLDGHFGAYTGAAPLLLGYHPQAHWMVPGHTHYFVCDRRGTPLFFDLDDESDDLRQVIPRHVRRVKALVGGEEKLTFVFDRGGYAHELFDSFERELDAYYVAWEKHDRTDYGARGEVAWEPFDVELQGNHEHTPRTKHLWVAPCPREVAVGAWGPKSPLRDHRKLLLRSALLGRGGGVRGYRIAPFLTNDRTSPAIAVARQLVGRWPQENEFKTLRHGYELDGITSYLTVPYADAAQTEPEAFARVAAREIANPRRKKLDAERRTLTRRLDTLGKRLARLACKEKRSSGHGRLVAVKADIERLRADLEAIETRRHAEPPRINQLRYLVEEGYERPDFSRKLLVDLLKVAARNARRQAEDLLRRHYPNRRDPATLLRRILHAGGRVRLGARGVLHVGLEPLNTAAENSVFERFLADINARGPRTSGPRGYPICFRLASPS